MCPLPGCLTFLNDFMVGGKKVEGKGRKKSKNWGNKESENDFASVIVSLNSAQSTMLTTAGLM